MISAHAEKRLLQNIIVLACAVPLAAGVSGVFRGVELLGSTATADLDSHFRYLSGLLLAIGLGFLSTVPHIEYHAARFRLLTCIVVIGGISRALGFLHIGVPTKTMCAALAMELVVTPLLCLWQYRLSKRFPH